ncbi:type VI secretion system tip protein TssI/VgrG [Isosphaeraceae bacterium EP7]
MSGPIQSSRTLQVETPLGPDAFILTGMIADEGVSQLYQIDLSLIATNDTPVVFDRLLGKKVGVAAELEALGTYRHFGGICKRITQGFRGNYTTDYRMEVVPTHWLLTRRTDSRIFQQKSVPEILKIVLAGLDVTYQLQGTYPSREFCAQYRETDFQFASRLMEDEGIFYFFTHGPGGAHSMVVADHNDSFVPDPDRPVLGMRDYLEADYGIVAWEQGQQLRSGQVTLFDHHWQRPHQHLEGNSSSPPPVVVGKHTHPQSVGNNGQLELYDYPGGYAHWFDGVDHTGGSQPGDLGKIDQQAPRIARIRLQEQLAGGIVAVGEGDDRSMAAGRRFTMRGHHDGDGDYIFTSVRHEMQSTDSVRSGGSASPYRNEFTAIPAGQPYRPARTTPRPSVRGPQTAVVTGPAGDEIFTDKYGRVKVHFHWDRTENLKADSSCWVRVGTPWAGAGWGAVQIPRIGQEVIVDFVEGDPDRPIITGSVFNAQMMPPYTLPDNKTQSGLKTRSTPQGGPENFNELRFEDKKGSEQVYMHAERDFDRVVENNDTLKVGSAKADDGSQTIEIWKDRTETVKTGNEKVTVEKGNRDVVVAMGNDSHAIKMGNRNVVIDMGNDSLKIKMGNQTTKLDLGASSTEALQSITLKVGQSSLTIDQMGVTIKGMKVTVQGQVMTEVKGAMVMVQADAMLKMGGGVTMIG